MDPKTKKLFEELLTMQERKVLQAAQRLVPQITKDDLLQPNDFPILEEHPLFRHEEGILEGIRVAYFALLQNNQD